MTTTSLLIEGTRIAIRESAGVGPAVVMIHGNSTSSRAFQHQFDGQLGSQFHLVALDLPGHGSSEWPSDSDVEARYTIPAFATVVAGVARALDLEDATFVGWSFGGHVLLEAAPQLPRARGFCVFGAPPIRFPPNMAEAFVPHPSAHLLFQETLSDQDIRDWVTWMLRPGVELPPMMLDDVRRADPRLRPAVLASIGRCGYQDEARVVAELRQPLAVLQGRSDGVVDLEYLRSLDMPSLWRGSVQIIEGAGHAPQWEAPHAFDELIRQFTQDACQVGSMV